MTPRPSDPAPARLAVRLTPRASRNAVTKYQDGVLHLRLTAPPVEGAANTACCRFVAALLGVPPGRVGVKAGHKSRDKVLTIEGLSSPAVELALTSYAVSEAEGDES